MLSNLRILAGLTNTPSKYFYELPSQQLQGVVDHLHHIKRVKPPLLKSFISCNNLQFIRSYQRRHRESNLINSESIWDEFELKEDGTLSISSFTDLGVTPSLCKALQEDGITTPTQVQDRALPITLSTRSNCMIQSETGSGKTLTFLLPAFQEQLPGLTSLVIVPSRELAVQILHQANRLCKSVRRQKRIMAFYTGAFDSEDVLQQKYVEIRPHILVATPKPLLKLLETNSRDFTHLRRVVLDEVDKMLRLPGKRTTVKKKVRKELHPRPLTLALKKLLKLKRTSSPQLIATSATLDRDVQEELVSLDWGKNPKIVSLSERGVDRALALPDTIEHCYLECDDTMLSRSGDQKDKMDALVEHFRSSKEKSALVFIHRGAPVTQFMYELQKRKVRVEALHECLNKPNRYATFLEAFRTGEIEFVVATEEIVRGLDFPWLNTVYLLEVPQTANEYLHLCGRVGRVRRRGRCVVIIENSREKQRMETHYKRLGVIGVGLTVS